MAGKRPKRQVRPEYNYMRWVLLVLALAGGYYGWKFGPGIYQRFMVQDIANRCAAKMWVMQDANVRKTVLEPELIKQKLSISTPDVAIKMDRTEDGGATRSCTIKFKYRNSHIWGSDIEKWYQVKGIAARKK